MLHAISKNTEDSVLLKITEKITHLQKEVKALQSENESLKSKTGSGFSGKCYGSGCGSKRCESSGMLPLMA